MNRIIFWVVVIVAIVFIFWVNPGLVSFSNDNVADYVNMLAPLVLTALFIERGLEVILTVWRGPESESKSLEIKHLKSKSDDAAVVKEKELLQYKGETQKKAFTASVCVGIVISALGIRALQMFVDADAFYELSDLQQNLFHVVDVIITGAMLGGGADGIHKVIAAFTTFMDSVKKNAETKAGT